METFIKWDVNKNIWLLYLGFDIYIHNVYVLKTTF
jgi:hypothetical protein